MKVLDKNIKQKVNVSHFHCLKCACYWPRPDPGVFTQGKGYSSRGGKKEWLCGTREIRGCPTKAKCCSRVYSAYEIKCHICGKLFDDSDNSSSSEIV